MYGRAIEDIIFDMLSYVSQLAHGKLGRRRLTSRRMRIGLGCFRIHTRTLMRGSCRRWTLGSFQESVGEVR